MAPGSIDFHSAEIQANRAAGSDGDGRELLEGQIRIEGNFETKIELVCARCLEPVVEEVSRTFDLFLRADAEGCQAERGPAEGRRYRNWFLRWRRTLPGGRDQRGRCCWRCRLKVILPERLPGAVPELRREPEP